MRWIRWQITCKSSRHRMLFISRNEGSKCVSMTWRAISAWPSQRCLVSTSLFAMYLTAFAGKAVGLAPALARALVPRSVTVALAIPVTNLLGGAMLDDPRLTPG